MAPITISFLYLFVSLFIALLDANYPGLPEDIDFSPFRNAVKACLNAPDDIPTINDDTKTTDCALPKNAVMFTYASHYLAEFISLQRKSMELWGLRSCLEKRFVTVCLDNRCSDTCSRHHISNCVQLNMTELPGADFASGPYFFFTWLKHELMYESLKVAAEVFYFDVDLLLLRNPWVDIQFGRDEQGNHIPGPYDLQWQRDRGRGPRSVEGNAYCLFFSSLSFLFRTSFLLVSLRYERFKCLAT
jgi:hypothetical protein